MKKQTILFLFISIAGLIFLFRCSDLREPLAVSPHPEGWENPQSANFHGKVLVSDSSLSLQSCRTCHGQDLRGGTSGVSCYQSSCHTFYPHPIGFGRPNSPDFHGKIIAEQLHWDITSCQPCHGQNYDGEGVAKKDCRRCHKLYPHREGYGEAGSQNFHGNSIGEEVNWDIRKCQPCHGENYDGKGVKQKNCRTCHTQPDGPEDCATCHGSAQNPAPPPDLANNTATDAEGVGAHQFHVADSTISTIAFGNCQHCHVVPQNVFDSGHIDNAPPPADVHFSTFATDSSRLQPQWNHDDATCSQVYCHGGFRFSKEKSNYSWAYADTVITGAMATPHWTAPETPDCTDCHGLPPQGHIAVAENSCSNCHPRVVDADLKIINPALHINGRADAF